VHTIYPFAILLKEASIVPSIYHIKCSTICVGLSLVFTKKKRHGLSLKNEKKKKRGKVACQRSMTHSEQERNDGIPKKHDPQSREKRWCAKEARPKKSERRKEIAMSSNKN